MGKVTLTIEAASLQEAVDMLRAELPNARMAAYATGLGMNPDDTYAAMTGRDPKPPAPDGADIPPPGAPTATVPASVPPVPMAGGSAVGAEVAASAPVAMVPGTTELDADGLPWDDRIHAGSQTKLAKTGQWKKKRGVEDEPVRQVEAELRLLMAVPSPAATPSVFAESDAAAAFTAPMPPVPLQAAQEFAPLATPSAVTPTSEIRTMAELTKAIIAAGLDMQTDVLPVLQLNGVQSLPLLGARSDLIPTIAARLFGGQS